MRRLLIVILLLAVTLTPALSQEIFSSFRRENSEELIDSIYPGCNYRYHINVPNIKPGSLYIKSNSAIITKIHTWGNYVSFKIQTIGATDSILLEIYDDYKLKYKVYKHIQKSTSFS